MNYFEWNPGTGINLNAHNRIRSFFSKPCKPMGEAWFMGENRNYFTELLGDLDSLPCHTFYKPLREITSGIFCFGYRDEWDEWYHYLLGQLILRSNETPYQNSLLESLISGFIALYPTGSEKLPYPQFKADVVQTLGRALMEKQCWRGAEISIGSCLHRSNNNPAGIWKWWNASGDFSASMFLCLKYVHEEQINNWLTSVFSISSPHWRAQVIVWFVGAFDILNGSIMWPRELSFESYPAIVWADSHSLGPSSSSDADFGIDKNSCFLDLSIRSIALSFVRTYFTDELYLEWLMSIATVPYLESELSNIPAMFESLYL